MNLITAGELASKDYEWLSERFDTLSPEFDQKNGRTVFAFFMDGFLNGYNNFYFAIALRMDSENRTSGIYCKSYETQNKTVFVEYDYEKALEIEKVFSQDIPEIVNKKRDINIDGGWENYIMLRMGDVIKWSCNIPHEWKMYMDCIKIVYILVNEHYPMTYDKFFYTKYESKLYSSGCVKNHFSLVTNGEKIYFVNRWSKCYDEEKQKPIMKLHYGKKMLVLSLSLAEREKLEDDLIDNFFIKLSDYEIDSIEICKSDYKED